MVVPYRALSPTPIFHLDGSSYPRVVKNFYFVLYNNSLFLFFSLFIECPKAPQLRQCLLCLLSIISTKRRCHIMDGLSHVDRGE